MAKKYYAVRQGVVPGIYENWDACKAQVHGYKNASYKSFPSYEEAKAFLEGSEEPSKKDLKTLLEDKDTLAAYVDGSYVPEQPTCFAYGIVYLDIEGQRTEKGRLEDADLATMRNVAGEITGASRAMAYALKKGFKKLYIYHDYEGISKWCTGEWRANREGTKAYQAYYQSIKDQLEIHFVKVTGHSNDRYNDQADQLAKEALGIED